MKPVLRRRPALVAAKASTEPTQATEPARPRPMLRARPKNVSTPEAKEKLANVFVRKTETEGQITIRRYVEKIRNPMTAIRAKCVYCSNGQLKEVAECRVTSCPLYPFRMGENPFNKKTRERLMRDGVIAADDSEDTDDDDASVD